MACVFFIMNVLVSCNASLYVCMYVYQELINLQEKNAILHKRLETMLNEVMDSVDNDQLLVKLSELKEKKSGLQDEIDEEEKEIEKWREDFISEMGREPTEDDR